MLPQVFIIDDDAAVRKGLTRLLSVEGYKVEAFESAESFLQHELQAGPACLVLDLCMPGVDGIQLQQRLETIGSKLPVIFLSGNAGVPDSVQAMKGGAMDFLTKPVEAEVLLEAITTAFEQHRRAIAAETEIEAIQRRINRLSPRERETLSWVISGMINKQIAAELGISEKTVKVHRARIMDKMGVGTVPELVRLCVSAGIQPAIGRRDE